MVCSKGPREFIRLFQIVSLSNIQVILNVKGRNTRISMVKCKPNTANTSQKAAKTSSNKSNLTVQKINLFDSATYQIISPGHIDFGNETSDDTGSFSLERLRDSIEDLSKMFHIEVLNHDPRESLTEY